MKKKAFNDLKTKDTSTLKKNVRDMEKEMINNILELKMGKVQNVHTTTNRKKDIARIKTILRMKEITEKESEISAEVKKPETKKILDSLATLDASEKSGKKEKVNAAN